MVNLAQYRISYIMFSMTMLIMRGCCAVGGEGCCGEVRFGSGSFLCGWGSGGCSEFLDYVSGLCCLI